MQHVWLSQGEFGCAVSLEKQHLTLNRFQVPSIQHGVLKHEEGTELRESQMHYLALSLYTAWLDAHWTILIYIL